jgi:hypothetical protein
VKKNELMNSFGDYWTTQKWNWFAILTFRECLTHAEAHRTFHKWIDEVQRDDGTATFDWTLIFALSDESPSFYLLVQGLRAVTKHYWVNRWQELAGEAFIEYSVCRGSVTRFLEDSIPSGLEIAIDYPGGELER